MRVLVVNGPNLNLLGTRSPDIYGEATLGELEHRCRDWGREMGIEVETYQSNHEGALIDRLHGAIGIFDGVILNPGALGHTSYALHDAIQAIGLPVVEIHISDIEAREPWRAESVIRPACVGAIWGKGIEGYREALVVLTEQIGS
ncbi:MAG TPA: type II 3-dehydroquinate dehydratase [Acidimicrobiia bacterium]|nr:type II 3-dehydroquinate dehydratase [Acidimicrobiia bacterium]